MSTSARSALSKTPVQASPAVQEMSLRDWFAGQALVGLIHAPKVPGVAALDKRGMAQAAYALADELLVQRTEDMA